MRYLVDTHVFLWWLAGDKKLPDSFRSVIENPQNQVFISVASFWEISIKTKQGKLPLKTTLLECFRKSAFETLDIKSSHVLTLDRLQMYHKDPFDRILIAQAKTEKLTILTVDPKIRKYFPQ